MKKLNQNQVDIILILINVIVAFFTPKLNISSIFMVLTLSATSFYFFPLKLILNKRKPYDLVSNILISISFGISIMGYYADFKTILSILGVLNFIFILYYVFFILNKKQEEDTSKLIIVAHYLVMFILITVL